MTVSSQSKFSKDIGKPSGAQAHVQPDVSLTRNLKNHDGHRGMQTRFLLETLLQKQDKSTLMTLSSRPWLKRLSTYKVGFNSFYGDRSSSLLQDKKQFHRPVDVVLWENTMSVFMVLVFSLCPLDDLLESEEWNIIGIGGFKNKDQVAHVVNGHCVDRLNEMGISTVFSKKARDSMGLWQAGTVSGHNIRRNSSGLQARFSLEIISYIASNVREPDAIVGYTGLGMSIRQTWSKNHCRWLWRQKRHWVDSMEDCPKLTRATRYDSRWKKLHTNF